jgi:hypothetical protein
MISVAIRLGSVLNDWRNQAMCGATVLGAMTYASLPARRRRAADPGFLSR